MHRDELEKSLSIHKRYLLGPLFKLASIDRKSVEDPNNFPNAPGDTGKYLKVGTHLFDAKDLFPEIRMA